jgi:predicted RNA-binding Zn-ribbon protein involved in translation (DUF1610 family)
VNDNNSQIFQANLSRFQSLLTILAICLVLGSLGLGWIVKSALIIIGLAIVTPIVGFLVFLWWVQKNIVRADCPVCGYDIQTVNGSQIKCPNCGEALSVAKGKLIRETPPDTIDITAIEVDN